MGNGIPVSSAGGEVGMEAEAREYSAFEELKKIYSDECKELSGGG